MRGGRVVDPLIPGSVRVDGRRGRRLWRVSKGTVVVHLTLMRRGWWWWWVTLEW